MPTENTQTSSSGLEAVLARRSWLELFFDLVAVAAIAVIGEGLVSEQTWAGLALFVALYATVWFSWLLVTTYSDVTGAAARSRTIIAAMLLLGIMAAANPLHVEERANYFALAFVAVRALVSRGSLASGRLLTSWTGLQGGGAMVIWIASLWVPAPAKFAVWAVAIALDIALSFVPRRFDGPRRLNRADRGPKGRRPSPRSERRGQQLADMTVTGFDAEHLTERLGLFFIIVLGEVVSKIVLASADQDWTIHYLSAALAAFVLAVSLFRETFLGRFGGAIGGGERPHVVTMGLVTHLVGTLGVVLLAGGIGRVLHDVEHHPDLITRVLLTGGLGLFLCTSLALGLYAHAGWRTWIRPAAGIIVMAVLCLVGGELGAGATLWIIVGCVLVLTSEAKGRPTPNKVRSGRRRGRTR